MFDTLSQMIAQLYKVGVIIDLFKIENNDIIIKISLPETNYLDYSVEQMSIQLKMCFDKIFEQLPFNVKLFQRVRKEHFTLEDGIKAEQLTLNELHSNEFLGLLRHFKLGE